ncbi:MAG TPA: hypothetical protein VFQ85_00740 [Mycobacteriales bacterium]|nr:hypothetical protein [Mycobacteriales bacterium]
MVRRLAAVAAAAVVAASAAVPSHAAAPPDLAGTSVFVAAASGSTTMRVRLGRRVTFPAHDVVPFVHVTGTADVAVAYLLPRERPLDVEPPTFGRLPRAVGAPAFATFPRSTTYLDPGFYDLVVVHTPGTAAVTVTFPGLRGRRTFRPSARSAAVVKPLSIGPLDGGRYGPAGTTGGTTATLAGRGFVQIAGALRLDRPSVTRIVACLKRREAALLPPPADFAPGCPGTDQYAVLGVHDDLHFFLSSITDYPAAPYGAGFSYHGAVLPTAAAGYAAFVPLPG